MTFLLPSGPALAALSAAPAAITTTEIVALNAKLPLNSYGVGCTIHVEAFGTISATSAGTIQGRLRAGTAGTIADAQVCASGAVGAAVAAVGWSARGQFVVRSLGGAGTCVGNLEVNVGANTGSRSAQTATTTLVTTSDNFLDLTFIGAGSVPSITVVSAVIVCLRNTA